MMLESDKLAIDHSRIGKDEKEARRILDPKHPTKLTTLTAALRELGQRLVIGVEPVAHRSVA
jgi:antitoxin HicB